MPISRLKADDSSTLPWICHFLAAAVAVAAVALTAWLWPPYSSTDPASVAQALTVGALGLILAVLLWATGLVMRQLYRKP